MFGKKRQKKVDRGSLYLMKDSNSFAYIEAYKSLRTNLMHVTKSVGSEGKAIMVTSSIPNEGKTTVSVNLAMSLAQDGKRVILIDCDLRKGTLGRRLHLSKEEISLTSLLTAQNAGGNKISGSFQRWEEMGIDILPAGSVPTNPSELLGSERMGAVLKMFRKYYDYIICDSAPVTVVTDSLALGQYTDGAVLVVAQDSVTKNVALETKQQLENVNVPVLGVVFNRYDFQKAGSKSIHGYSYYRNYGYGYGENKKRTRR